MLKEKLDEAAALYRQVLDSEDFEDDEPLPSPTSAIESKGTFNGDGKEEKSLVKAESNAIVANPSPSPTPSISGKKREVKVDKLQRIHACYNLAQVIERQMKHDAALITEAAALGATGNMDAINQANDERQKEIAKLKNQVMTLKKVYLRRPATNLLA
jgi:hypothetical protein